MDLRYMSIQVYAIGKNRQSTASLFDAETCSQVQVSPWLAAPGWLLWNFLLLHERSPCSLRTFSCPVTINCDKESQVSHITFTPCSSVSCNYGQLDPRQLQPEGQGVIYNFLTTYANSIINLTCSIAKLKIESGDQVIRIYQDLLSMPKITSITERDSSFPGGRRRLHFLEQSSNRATCNL